MPTRDEIIQRALAAQNAIVDRQNAYRAENRRQERAAVSTVPAGRAAFESFDASRRAIAVADATARRNLEATLAEANRSARTTQAEAERIALSGYLPACATADRICEAAGQVADAAYQAAYLEALREIGPAQDVKLAAARATRDTARAAAGAACVAAYDAASQAEVAGMDAARETAVIAGERAQAAYVQGVEAADAALRDAEAGARDTLLAAIRGDATAAALQMGFALTLDSAEREAEVEKDAVRAQMRRDLEALGG